MKRNKLRAVVDTNVLISAALSAQSSPAQITRWLLAQGRILFSKETFEELETRLWRPKFDRYLTMESRKSVLHDFSALAEWVELDGRAEITGVLHSRDADDDKFIHTALIGEADVLVSGDADLLDLGRVGELAILSPAEALAWVAAREA